MIACTGYEGWQWGYPSEPAADPTFNALLTVTGTYCCPSQTLISLAYLHSDDTVVYHVYIWPIVVGIGLSI